MKKYNKKFIKFIIVGVMVPIISLFGGCSSDDEYENTLKSGYSKYLNGDSMTREEYNAVKGFNNWKSKQGEKTYDEWD